ncbi:hypothetical protein tloyanaT_35900 [Thalassotalea loyana]|uniref:N-acetyltransferase domain-containing protein n=1 Tax=Thalassotalea loyana TaxID=280483 RepID=A0ABQ6HI39_9GAMM|nr:GNAT family N-acetyltransferase [Thalassotalea loyana]GLX87337.1 hypothetical protein tloyanaT_35900 [Thalassotalea loyana]
MTEHLSRAGIAMDDQKHLVRIDEFFEDSLIIEYKSHAIGLIKLGRFIDRLHIRQLQILPNFQNKGIGEKVINRVVTRAREINQPVTLNVLKQNPALRLYQRLGFRVEQETELEFFMKLSVDR